MRKINALAMVFAVFILVANSVLADTNTAPDADQSMEQEKCKVVDSNGNGLIKPYMADSGINLENDADAWIYVPYGECAKLNAGDFSGVSAAIREKIQPSDITEAATTETLP